MNILFTCAGRRTYLLEYFRDNLEPSDRIVAADMQLSAPALQVADIKIQVPSVYSEEYVDRLLKICKDYDIDALISLNDLELPILAGNKPKFEELGVRVIVSDLSVINLCFDKYETSKWVESLGLNTPKTYVCIEDVKRALVAREVSFPLFMKPRWGSGSIGLVSVADMEELEIYYKLLTKKIKDTILSTASVGDRYILIQEKLTGNEYGLDVINDLNGNNIAVTVKQKLAMRSGETDKAVTCNLPEVREIGHIIGSALCHIGNLDMDIMKRENGDYCVLELNPRFGGGFPFSYMAGVNLPGAIIKWIKGETVNPSILECQYDRMFAKNDYLIEIK